MPAGNDSLLLRFPTPPPPPPSFLLGQMSLYHLSPQGETERERKKEGDEIEGGGGRRGDREKGTDSLSYHPALQQQQINFEDRP